MEISTLNIKRIIIDIFEIFIPEFNLIIKHCELKLNNKKTIFIPWHKGMIHNQL